MSQHPSLRIDSVGTKHRNVLKRFERIKKMQEENRWMDRESVYNLPKIKSIKIKVKKAKDEAPAEGEAQAAAAPAAAGTAAPKTAVAPKTAAAAGPKAATASKGAADKAKK